MEPPTNNCRPAPAPQALKSAHLASAPNSSRASLVDPRRMTTLRGTLPWQVARDRDHSALAELLHPDLPLGFVLEQEELEQVGGGGGGCRGCACVLHAAACVLWLAYGCGWHGLAVAGCRVQCMCWKHSAAHSSSTT
jgi:hypothetical protein